MCENMCVAVCKYVVKCADLSCVGFWECMCMCDSMTVRQCQCHFVRGGRFVIVNIVLTKTPEIKNPGT